MEGYDHGPRDNSQQIPQSPFEGLQNNLSYFSGFPAPPTLNTSSGSLHILTPLWSSGSHSSQVLVYLVGEQVYPH